MTPSRVRLLAIAGLILAWGLPELHLSRLLFPGETMAAHVGRETIWWLLGAILVLWIVVVERQPLASIGLLPPRPATVGWGLVFVVPAMASVMLSYAVLFPMLGLHQNMEVTHSLIAVPLWLQTATMVRAGVVEEVLYRGYPIERLTLLTGRRWLAATLSIIVFTAAHISTWGYSQLIVVVLGAIVLTSLYLWRRDLPACMIAHALTDIIGFAIARAHGW